MNKEKEVREPKESDKHGPKCDCDKCGNRPMRSPKEERN